MMATVPQVTSGLGLRKFQADGFLLTRVYKSTRCLRNKPSVALISLTLLSYDCILVIHCRLSWPSCNNTPVKRTEVNIIQANIK